MSEEKCDPVHVTSLKSVQYLSITLLSIKEVQWTEIPLVPMMVQCCLRNQKFLKNNEVFIFPLIFYSMHTYIMGSHFSFKSGSISVYMHFEHGCMVSPILSQVAYMACEIMYQSIKPVIL